MRISKRNAIIAASILTIQFGSVFAIGFGTNDLNHTPDAFHNPCPSESANGCYWDASNSGNGIGSSYVVTQDGQVFRFDPSVSARPGSAFGD